jgi:snapalysin
MLRRRLLALSTAALASAALGVGGSTTVATAATAATAHAAPVATTAAVTTLTYDDSLAGEFKTAVAQGVAALNSRVTNVQIVKATSGQPVNVRVIADNNWPRATLGPIRPGGRGTVYMGRQAVWQGYYPPRIASHEFGHIVGLPDRRTGLCSDLMSGSSAPTSCTNMYPSAREAAQIDYNYSFFAVAAAGGVVPDAA